MLKFRLISFVGLMSLLAMIIFSETFGPFVLIAMSSAIAFGLVYELGTMFEKIGMPSFKLEAGIWSALLTVLVSCFVLDIRVLTESISRSEILLYSLLFGAVFAWSIFGLIVSKDFEFSLKKYFATIGIVCFSMPIVLGLVMISESLMLFATVILTTKSGDIGAYCVGTLSNKITKGKNHYIAPRISPKKSIEGTIGGMIIAMSICYVFIHYIGKFNISLEGSIVIGFVLFWLGFFGDLTESVIKRACGVKDSGKLLPGMGGVWDFMDSFIYVSPVIFVFGAVTNITDLL